jgi:hypothetical protein
MLGVAIECSNIGLPVVTRYCGPAAKLVSCAEQNAPSKASNASNNVN